jgi:hypothetical protein
MYGLSPFDPTKEVKKLKSLDQLPSKAELKESETLMTQKTEVRKELSVELHWCETQVEDH